MKIIQFLSSKLTKRSRSSTAQAFVEFALTLPLLLMLVFGIIEYGRLLQAWLALENGARFAVRYAVTGSYDPAFCAQADAALEPLYPGITAEDTDNGASTGDCQITIPTTATNDQKVTLQAHQDALIDWARLPSIRATALAGATGIALDPTAAISGTYTQYLTQAYTTDQHDTTYRGDPSRPGYFDISTCSNRVNTNTGDFFRFDTNSFYLPGYPAGQETLYRYPDYCEEMSPDGSSVVRYVDDAGGPGDRVRIVLTYRHTLITPFLSSWWPTLRLSTSREGLVEKFRTSRVTGLSGSISYAPTWTNTPPPPTQTLTPTITLTPTVTSTSTVTLTPTVTVTRTTTPYPDCGQLQNLTSGTYGEDLAVDRYSTTDGWVQTIKLYNIGPYNIYLTAAYMNYNGTWHNQFNSAPTGKTFDQYTWVNNSPQTSSSYLIYDAADTGSNPIQHTFSTPFKLIPSSNSWFKWNYTQPFRFWMFPDFSQYPARLPGTATAQATAGFIPQKNGTPTPQSFFWSSDFDARISYNVVPVTGATVACTLEASGLDGPIMNITVDNVAPFDVEASITNGQAVPWVYFYVYDSNGNLVHYNQEVNATTGGGQYCLFDRNAAKTGCTQYTLDNWWYYGDTAHPSQQITNGTYTVVIMTQNKHYSPKSNIQVRTLVILQNTQTPTRTSTITNTPTKSGTPTKTGTVTETPTRSVTPTITKTPTITQTPTITRTPTRTVRPTNTTTPTECQVLIDANGCAQ